jgi:hypothetical protein
MNICLISAFDTVGALISFIGIAMMFFDNRLVTTVIYFLLLLGEIGLIKSIDSSCQHRSGTSRGFNKTCFLSLQILAFPHVL